MSIHRLGNWGGEYRVGTVVRFRRDRDACRIGHGCTEPPDGALCVLAQLTGDHFYRVEVIGTDLVTSAYAFGDEVEENVE